MLGSDPLTAPAHTSLPAACSSYCVLLKYPSFTGKLQPRTLKMTFLVLKQLARVSQAQEGIMKHKSAQERVDSGSELVQLSPLREQGHSYGVEEVA